MSISLDVLFEDNHLLVVNKPAPLATMGTAADEGSLVKIAKQYLKGKYQKPGNVYLGVVSRLDAWVTGVLVMARTSKAAGRLSEQFRNRSVRKRYLALVEGCPPQAKFELTDYLVKSERHKRMQVVPQGQTQDAHRAELKAQVLARQNDVSLLDIELVTGRKHQIRVQLENCGVPILGDRKYGGERPFERGIALHAYRLHLEHPVKRVPLDFVCAPPVYWQIDRFIDINGHDIFDSTTNWVD